MVRVLLISAAIGASALVAGADETVFSQKFVFTKLPSSLNGNWKAHGDGSKIESEKLVIDSGRKDYLGWYFNKTGNHEWDGSRPTTVEFRMRVRDMPTESGLVGASLTISDGSKSYRFSFRNREMQTYRITLDKGLATLYLVDVPGDKPRPKEGADNPPLQNGEVSPNAITFGDLYSNVKGVSEWEFLRWTNEGAFPP